MTEANLVERPLVTFALFAYNQEKYIREAVEGAFSQTYEPLEIILSDDCSSDRTFEIMQEMAAGYRGPHRVVVRRSERNVGIIDHVISVARTASGSLFVVAAGDDISYYKRTSVLVDSWINTGAAAIYSGCDEISEKGSIVRSNWFPEPLERVQDLFKGCKSPIRYDGKVRNIPGYSAAYDRGVVAGLPLTYRNIHNEDALLTYVINLASREIVAVRVPLLARRISLSSISAASRFDNIDAVLRNEKVIQVFSRSSLEFVRYFCGLSLLEGSNDFFIVCRRLRSRISYYKIVSEFWDVRSWRRFELLVKARSWKEVTFVVPRLLGQNLFCLIKMFHEKLKARITEK